MMNGRFPAHMNRPMRFFTMCDILRSSENTESQSIIRTWSDSSAVLGGAW